LMAGEILVRRISANDKGAKGMEERRIERRTASMLKRNYTTKPHPHLLMTSKANIKILYNLKCDERCTNRAGSS
jgi:hypothetical protein